MLTRLPSPRAVRIKQHSLGVSFISPKQCKLSGVKNYKVLHVMYILFTFSIISFAAWCICHWFSLSLMRLFFFFFFFWMCCSCSLCLICALYFLETKLHFAALAVPGLTQAEAQTCCLLSHTMLVCQEPWLTALSSHTLLRLFGMLILSIFAFCKWRRGAES